MPLTKEQIDLLLAQAAATAARGGKRAPKPVERTHEGWFSLHHKLMHDADPYKPMKCENPNCDDPRGRDYQVCAEVNGKLMCRFCFLGGWLTIDPPNQTTIET